MPQVVDLRKKKPIPEIRSSSRADPRSPKGMSRKKIKKIKVETKKSRSASPASRQDGPKTNIPTRIEWATPEFTKHKKNKQWFVLPALAALAIIIVAILLKNVLLVVATILAAFVVYIYALKEPRKIKSSISGKGIQVDKRLYKFEDLKSFWIFYDPLEIKEISLRSKKTFVPYIKIPLGNQDPVEVRKLLLKFLPEKKHKESRIDELARKSRF